MACNIAFLHVARLALQSVHVTPRRRSGACLEYCPGWKFGRPATDVKLRTSKSKLTGLQGGV